MREAEEPFEETTEETVEERPAIAELVGESEYSMHQAHLEERLSSRRIATGPATWWAAEPEIEDLEWFALEQATEAPVERTRVSTVPLRGPFD